MSSNPPAPKNAPPEVSLVSHHRQFEAAYKIGDAWIAASPRDTMREALEEIRVWREEYEFDFPMRVTQIKTTRFVVH